MLSLLGPNSHVLAVFGSVSSLLAFYTTSVVARSYETSDMGHYLIDQDTECDQTDLDSTLSRIWRSTYQASPAELQAAYASLNPTFLQRMQVRNTMYIREPLFSKTAANTEQHSSANPARRSVLGMKNLLPLKLSPNPSDNAIWPSSAPCDRTTFGMRYPRRIEGRPVSMAEPQSGKTFTQGLRRNREFPIYTEPGIPLPGLENFTHGETDQPSSEADVFAEEPYIANNYDIEQKIRPEHEVKNPQQTIEDVCGSDNSLLCSQLENVSPSSTLSFKCAGNDVYPDDAVWLKSPLNEKYWPRPNALSAAEIELMFTEYRGDSWLSDTSSYLDQDGDMLDCATVLAPSKANVVTLSPSSGLAISIPARSSSLDRPTLFRFAASNSRYSYSSSDYSPPNTPVDSDISNPVSTKSSSDTSFTSSMNRQDIGSAMLSPPLSPSSYSKNILSRISHKRSTEKEKPSWPFSDNTSSGLSVSSLHEWMAKSSSIEKAGISEIRSQISQAHISEATERTQPESLLSPIFLTSELPRQKLLRRRKTTDLSRHRVTMRFTAQHSPLPTPFSVLTDQPRTTRALSPDLNPIQNIFPNSTKTAQSSLYASVLAYIDVTSSLQALPSTASMKQRRRNTPHWHVNTSPVSRKAADVLGIYSASTPEPTKTAEEAAKMQILQEELRKNIFCLISDMDDNFAMEKHGVEPSSGMIILRLLVEVVRSAEERAPSFF